MNYNTLMSFMKEQEFMKNNDYFSKVLLTYEQINKRIEELASDLNATYQNAQEDILVIPVMDGSLVFASHLILNLNFALHVRSTKISSYDNSTTSNQDPQILIHIPMDKVKGRRILIIEDLVDTGLTLSKFKKYLLDMGASEVKICVLFQKDIPNRQLDYTIDFLGFTIPNEWVAGFGVDSQGNFRNLRDFGVVNKKYIKS